MPGRFNGDLSASVPRLGTKQIALVITPDGYALAVVVALNRPVLDAIRQVIREELREALKDLRDEN